MPTTPRTAARPAASGKAVAAPAARKKSAAQAAKPSQGTRASLTLSSKNYSSWSLRGWLLARFAGLDFDEVMVSTDDADARRELLLLAPSIRVPCLEHEGAKVWNTMAIGHYLSELFPQAGLLPADRLARAHCLAICGEMNSGFANLRSALPMNMKVSFATFKIWGGAKPDIERIVDIWTDCLTTYGGPYLFGQGRTMADAMYAPVASRFLTYGVKLDSACTAYCATLMAMPEIVEWRRAAEAEPDEIEELDMEF